jgi:hypothetical protein
MRATLNWLGRSSFVLGAGGYIGVHAAATAHPAPGWNVLLYVLMGAGAILAVVTESSIRQRRPTLHMGHRGGAAGIWFEPSAKPLPVRRRSLRRRTELLVHDWHRFHSSSALSQDDLEQVNQLMDESEAAGEDRDAVCGGRL